MAAIPYHGPRMRFRTLALAVLLGAPVLGAAAPAPAQRTFRTIGTDIRNGLGDIWYVWSSPFHASGRDWLLAGASLAGTAAISAADEDIHRWIVEHPRSEAIRVLYPLRERDDFGMYNFGGTKRLHPAAGALYLLGFVLDKPGLRDAGVGCLAAQQAGGLPRGLLYRVVSRPRPYIAPTDAYDLRFEYREWPYRSFFGGHAANIMSCAAFWNERFHLGVAEPAIYALAAGIGLGRMADGRHWTSDTALGFIVGYAVGMNVGRRSRLRAEAKRGGIDAPSEEPASGFFVTHDGAGFMRVGWQRAF